MHYFLLVISVLCGFSCHSWGKEMSVAGNSLTPIFASGQIVEVVKPIDIFRGNIVIFNYAGNRNPIIKIIKAIPGDMVGLVKGEGSGWNIHINNALLRNSEGLPYRINERAHRLLSLYISEFGGKIPKGTYLILGNLPEGTMDSTVFGFINGADIVGKVKFDKGYSANRI